MILRKSVNLILTLAITVATPLSYSSAQTSTNPKLQGLSGGGTGMGVLGSGSGNGNGNGMSGGNRGGELQSTISTGVMNSCPFMPVSQGSQALLTDVQNALSDLRREQEQCSGVQQTATALDNLLRNQLQGTFADGDNACANYEAVYRRDYDRAMASVEGKTAAYGTSNGYTQCTYSSVDDPRECMRSVYLNLLQRKADDCRAYEVTARNQPTRENLQAAVDLTVEMVAASPSCSPDTAQKVTQLAISQIGVIASMASGFGEIGLAAAATARIASAVAGRLFGAGQVESSRRLLQQEEQWPRLACLYYNVQKSVLRCDEDVYGDRVMTPVTAGGGLCEAKQTSIAELSRLSASLRAELSVTRTNTEGDERAPTAAETQARNQRVMQFAREILEKMEEPIQVSATESIPYHQLIRDAGAALKASSSGPDKIAGGEIDQMMALYDQLKAADGNPDVVIDGSMRLVGMMSGVPVVPDQRVLLNLPDALARYAALASDNTLAGSVQARSFVVGAVGRGNESAARAQQDLGLMSVHTDQRALDVGLNAMVTNFRETFENRLTQLDREYAANGANQTPRQNIGILGPMLDICVNTQGMSHFQRPTRERFARTSIGEASRPYAAACAKFNCPNGSLFSPYNQADPRLAAFTQPAEKFRQYQCALDRGKDDARARLYQNITSTGTICGSGN